MTDTEEAAPPPSEDLAVADSRFLRALVSLVRADDRNGAWDGYSDERLLRDFVLTKDDRKRIPIVGNPDPDTVTRLEQFHKAAALLAERETGVMADLMTKMSHEGFGRLVLIGGKLCVYSRHLRDVHRFGFPSRTAIDRAGERITAEIVETIKSAPELARA